ncbi:hypothetical protein RUM44_004815 [Polyplax serrata]|uniref:Uncharacterized protein n=1 Tax=Polyplax serrata TaxID=468196 RepID=A0ABR1B3X3_POLSC
MAGKAIKYPLAQFSKRGLSAQVLAKQAQSSSSPDVNCTVLPNKFLVSTLDIGGPLSRVTIAFKAGPRNEMENNLGATHVIRSMTGFSTEKCTGFALVRNLQQNGIHFTCSGDREVTSYSIVASRNKINCALKYLGAAAAAPAFKPWQVADNVPRIKYEIGSLTPQARVMDTLHKACYRTGLGNSLFVPQEYIGKQTSEMLKNFYSEGFTANRGSLAAYNVDHNDMLEFARGLELSPGEAPVGNSKYFGGEIRRNTDSCFAHVAVATQGVGSSDIKASLVLSVLQYAYGVKPSIIWGGSSSPLYKATHCIAPDSGVACFNIKYTDSGLFGVMVSGFADSCGKAVEAAVKVIKSASVSSADTNRAKAMLKMEILNCSETTEGILEDMAVQSLSGGVVVPALVLAEAIDKITHADVSEAAKRIARGKFSLAAEGDLRKIPYLDELP